MKKKEKENLILVHSFPTNSIILKNLIDYLNKYINVYFIDLPGFAKDKKPLSKITLKNYSKFVDKKIKEFNLKHYIIGGISFGFLVVNNAKLNKNCIGIMGIEPYIDESSLNMPPIRKFFYNIVIKAVDSFNLYSKVWNKSTFHRFYKEDYPKKVLNTVITQIDPFTFFRTARIIVNNRYKLRFHRLPYVLLINKKDKTIKADYVTKIFQNNIKDLLIINTKITHYPKDLSKNYFKKHLPKSTLVKIDKFFKK